MRSIAREYGWSDFQPKEKVILKIDPKFYADYTGKYQFEFSADYVLTISTQNGNLIAALKQPTETGTNCEQSELNSDSLIDNKTRV